jgi:ABC-2 type transport system permease protein
LSIGRQLYRESIAGGYDIHYVNDPHYGIINAYRDVFYFKVMPNIMNLSIVGLISILILFIGYFIFDKLQKGFAEEV